MSNQTMDCPKELNESIKTKILTKANYENSEAATGRAYFRLGSVLTIAAILILGAIKVFTEISLGWDTITLIYAFPVLWIAFGAVSFYYEKYHRDHEFHAIADKIRQERSKQYSFCTQKIMEHYSTPLKN